MAELPFGRGYRVGEDNYVAQGESFALREAALPPTNAWFVSNLPISPYGSSGGSHGATLRLSPIIPIDGEFHGNKARLRITNDHSGGNVKSAIYRYSKDSGYGEMTKVAGSDAIFLTDSTGLKTVDTGGDVILHPGEKYFIGHRSSNTGISITSDLNTSSRLLPTLNMVHSNETLKSRIPISQMAKTYGLYLAYVVYLSKFAEEIL